MLIGVGATIAPGSQLEGPLGRLGEGAEEDENNRPEANGNVGGGEGRGEFAESIGARGWPSTTRPASIASPPAPVIKMAEVAASRTRVGVVIATNRYDVTEVSSQKTKRASKWSLTTTPVIAPENIMKILSRPMPGLSDPK